jgi:hypothetical protein
VAAAAGVEAAEEAHHAAAEEGRRAAAEEGRRAAVRARAVAHRRAAVADRAMWHPALRRCRGRVLPTSNDQVAARARLQAIGHRWATCRRPAKGRVQGLAIGLAQEMSPTARAREVGPAEVTLRIGRTSVISPAPALAQALARELSPEQDQRPVRDRRLAMCKTLLICRMQAAVTPAAAAHPVALVTPRRWPAAPWQVEQLQSFCRIVRMTLVWPDNPAIELMPVFPVSQGIGWMPACLGNLEIGSMRVFPVSRGIEWMRVYPGNLEIESMLVFPVSQGIEWMRVYRASRGIEWMRVYRVNPEIESMLAGRGSQTSVDRGGRATTFKIFQAELLTGGSGKIGARRISATFATIGKTIGVIMATGTAIVGGTTITSIIRTLQDSVYGQVPRGRDSPIGAITAGRNLSITAMETTFITTMARCITGINRCARKPSTFSKPRRSC